MCQVMIDTETWLPVKGYEDRYEVSDRGRVRSRPLLVSRPGVTPFFHPLSDRVLAQTTTPRGYKQVMLHGPQGRRTKRVHRLVCQAFCGDPPADKPEALHRDDIPGNNFVGNLRWGSHDENLKEADRNGRLLKGENHSRAKLSDEAVAEIRRLGRTGSTYKEIADQYGVHWCYVQKIILRSVRVKPSRLRRIGRIPAACRPEGSDSE